MLTQTARNALRHYREKATESAQLLERLEARLCGACGPEARCDICTTLLERHRKDHALWTQLADELEAHQ